jgi:hypothetical protein
VIESLARELAAVGIHGRQRERILAELGDHLACDPEADLGDPRALAQEFADDLARDTTRRAALWTFGALVLVAAAVAVPQLVSPTIPDIAAGRSLWLALPATLAVVIGAQVAFAAGCLAGLRAFRRPDDVGVVRRRTVAAIAAGALTAAGSALSAANFWGVVPHWWCLLAVTAAVAAAAALASPAHACRRVRPIRVTHTGADGLSADLGPLAHPLLIGAGATFGMLAITSLAERSVVEGALRAGFEAVAFAVCFVALRRPLALSN